MLVVGVGFFDYDDFLCVCWWYWVVGGVDG